MRLFRRVADIATFAILVSIVSPLIAQTTEWKIVPGHIATRWAKDVSPERVWPEYPRPTMVRKDWLNLNGLWDYAIQSDAAKPTAWSGKILVPFPVESALSGVAQLLEPDKTLQYRRTFEIPEGWKGRKVRLHFGAVDWQCEAFINDQSVGGHKGGYDPFNFDITEKLKSGANELRLVVTDPTNTGGQPRGKQWLKPNGIWYTRSSGIWQTVWLEPLPEVAIGGLRIIPHALEGKVDLTLSHVLAQQPAPELEQVEADVLVDGKVIASEKSPRRRSGVSVKIPQPHLWSPHDPFLYQARIRLFRDGKLMDEVESYFGLRDIQVAKDAGGINRLMLNGKPVFHFGPLDQGFWPDGLYTPPTENAMKFDIQAVKEMGGNMLRKHVKVESERFYYCCDRLGVMVWQDMPSAFFKTPDFDDAPALNDGYKSAFEAELLRMIQSRGNHPSIVMWVPFNEGWGQNDLAWAKHVVDVVKEWDPTRLVNNASGWTDMGNGDVRDIHVYPAPSTVPPEKKRAIVLGEFGGLGLPLEGHTWIEKNNWGYATFKTKEELTAKYVEFIRTLPLLAAEGLCAAVYTQTTDVEIEVNGWLTYDREIWKIDPKQACSAAAGLDKETPRMKVISPQAGGETPQQWRYTFEKPADDWMKPGASLDEKNWKIGAAGFGTAGTPGAEIGTEWKSGDIWLRRDIEVTEVSGRIFAAVHHDEDAEIYMNGELVLSLKGYTTGYKYEPLPDAAIKALRSGPRCTLAVHCKQTSGGQYIDVGLIAVESTP